MANAPDVKASLAIVIVTFEPNVALFSSKLAALTLLTSMPILVIDNTVDASAAANLKVRLTDHIGPNFLYLHNANKGGIAGGLNLGIKAARENHPCLKGIVLLDDDSFPSAGFFSLATKLAEKRFTVESKTACIFSQWRDEKTGRIAPAITFNANKSIKRDLLEQVDFGITSGSVINPYALNDVGGMNEQLFIDHVDTEWCIRARLKGWRLYKCNELELNHNLGDYTVRIWMGRSRYVAVHRPFRCFYVVRNSLYLLTIKGLSLSERWFHLKRLVLYIGFNMIVPSQRFARLRFICKGVIASWKVKSSEFKNKR